MTWIGILIGCLLGAIIFEALYIRDLRTDLKDVETLLKEKERSHVKTCNRRKCRYLLDNLMVLATFSTAIIIRLKAVNGKENISPAITKVMSECYEMRESVIETIRMTINIDERKFHQWLKELYSLKIPPQVEKRAIRKKQPIKGNVKGDKERMKAMFEKYGYTYEKKQEDGSNADK